MLPYRLCILTPDRCGAESGAGSSIRFGIACVEVWGFECEERIAMNLRYMEYGVDPWEDTGRKR